MNVINKQRTPFIPNAFAFGGGTKPISEIIFSKYDKDKSGTISRDELRSLCYDMGYYLNDDELEWACTVLDKDGNGQIDYREFAEWWRTSSRFEHLRMPNGDEAELICQIAKIFRSHDTDNNGKLDKEEFEEMKKQLIEYNIIVEYERQACQFEEIDCGCDGSINFNELIAWFRNIRVLN